MEFEITCPIDGPVEVSIEDIENVVLREAERADITFTCPHCGTEITVTAVVPSFLLAAIEALVEDDDTADVTMADLISVVDTSSTRYVHVLSAREEAYCEYFRRQLSHVDSVEDALAEMDSKAGA